MRMLFGSLPTWRSLPAAALLAVLVSLCSPAHAAALVTIVDGESTLIDGARSLVAVEGLKVGDETLVRTGAKATLLRVEWPDGSVADFGPDTQAMLNPGGFGTRGGRTPSVYLLRGWLKLSAMGTGPASGMLAPRLDVQPFKGALAVMVVGDETWVFAESGGAPLIERDKKPVSTVSLKSGEVYLRSGAAKGAVTPRPTPAQMQLVPRGFRDSLPLRSAALKDRTVAPKAAPPPGYAEFREWLLVEAPLRKTFTRRFVERTRDPAFRAGLVEHLSQHPEWEPVLFPERFVKPASAPR
jgi:hypothetical protein